MVALGRWGVALHARHRHCEARELKRPSGNHSEVPPPTVWEKLAWCLFDFANSSFTTVIVTVVYAQYFTAVVVGEEGWLGIKGDTLWNQASSVSQFLVLLSAPVIGAMADRFARKKSYLFRSWAVCVVATAALCLPGPGAVWPALLIFMVANVAFSTGENLVAGFLPELARPDEMGRLSGYGWAIGYLGGLGALVLALYFADAGLVRWTPLSTAAFFAVAALPTFLVLRERAQPSEDPQRSHVWQEAFKELHHTWRDRHRFQDTFRFLLVVLLFQSGVVVVILNSSIYGQQEIGMSQSEMIKLFMLLQISSALGALVFGWMQDMLGSRPTLWLALALWVTAVLLAFEARDAASYTVAGLLAGVAMGSSQSASRALVGLFAPRGREAEWFGLWGFATKSAAVLGPLLYSLVLQFGSRRGAILFTAAFFLLGMIALFAVNVGRGRRAAGRIA